MLTKIKGSVFDSGDNGLAINVKDFGVVGDGSTDDTAVLNLAFSGAIALGLNKVILDSPQVTLGTDVDCLGCTLIASNTNVLGSGRFINSPYTEGLIVNNITQIGRAIHPLAPSDSELKIIEKVSANEYAVYVKKKTDGYLRLQYTNNLTTPADSLATTTSDTTAFRLTSVSNCVDVWLGFKGNGTTVGTWASTNMITDIAETFTSGIEYTYEYATGAVSKEYTIDVQKDGYFNVGLLYSSTASTSVNILVDGVSVLSGIDTSSGTASVNIHELKTTAGTRVVKVESASGRLNVLGCNVSRLMNAKHSLTRDSLGYYRNNTAYKDYLSSTSANDYAIRDKDADVWGGSYHGGETSISTDVVIGNTATALSIGDIRVSNNIELRQGWTLDWSGLGGGTLTIDSTEAFIKSGVVRSMSFTGSQRVESHYTTLVGINEDFSQVIFPHKKDLTTLAGGDREFLGKNSQVIYEVPTTSQRLSVNHSIYNNEENSKGGAFVWHVVGLYNKYYYSMIDRGDRTIADHSAVTITEFY
jgi:hypothetical protein